jgi:hypothetical protein
VSVKVTDSYNLYVMIDSQCSAHGDRHGAVMGPQLGRQFS